MPKVYLGNTKLVLRPDSAFTPGREGTVYPDPSDPGSVIKLPHSPDDEWRDKIRAMLADPLNTPDVAWPSEVVLSPDRSAIVGCQLPFAARKYPIAAVYSTDPTARWLTADYSFRVEVAINLVAAVGRVHDHGCVVGDLSPANILVGKDGSVCLIDTDSFQVARNGRIFRCNVGTPDYTPAELHGPNFCDVDRTQYHDAFGLAELVFQLLVGPGTHPFAARHVGSGTSLSLIERIRLGVWPYMKGGHPDYVPRTGAPLDLVHPVLRPLIFRCFETGHKRHTERPLPAEWLLALNDVKQDTDFVRVLAPRLEADAQLRQRQAILTALAPHSARKRTSPIVRGAHAALRHRSLRKVMISVAASMLLLATGVCLTLAVRKHPQIDFAESTQRSQQAPELYLHSGSENQTPLFQPRNADGLLPTPTLYQEMADPYR